MLFCKRDQYLVLLHTSPLTPAEESIPTATAPYFVLFQLRSVGTLCRVCRTTRRHTKDRNLSADHLEHFHTEGSDPPTKSRSSVRIASAIVVLNSTNGSTVSSLKLFVCLMTLPEHFVLALRYWTAQCLRITFV